MTDPDHPDLDARLTDLLARSATAVDVVPDLDAAVSAGDGAVATLDDHPRRNRRRLAVAGIAAALLAAVAVATRPSTDDTVDVAGPPAAGEAVYPIVDLPREMGGARVAMKMEERPSSGPLGAPLSRAVLGTELDDGSLSDLIEVEVGAPGPTSIDEAGGVGIEVGGRTASMTGDGQSVYVEGDPRVAFHGAEEVMSRVRAFSQVDASWSDGVAALTLTLPSPTRSVLPLAAVLDEPMPALDAFGPTPDAEGPAPQVSVRTLTDDPIAELAFAGGMDPIEVDGSPGFQVPAVDGGQVAWTTPGGINVVVEVHGLGPNTDVEIARSLRLVDLPTWQATYRDGPLTTVADTVAPSTPEAIGPATTTDEGTVSTDPDPGAVIGPAPDPPGPTTEGEEVTWSGHWSVVALTVTPCPDDPCSDVLAVLSAIEDGILQTAVDELQLVALVDGGTVGEAADAASAAGFDGAVVPTTAVRLMETWGVSVLPAVAVVNPAGDIVGYQSGGPITVEGVDAALPPR